jgi:hypothetical protein
MLMAKAAPRVNVTPLSRSRTSRGQEDGPGDDREVLTPAFHQPQPGPLNDLQDSVTGQQNSDQREPSGSLAQRLLQVLDQGELVDVDADVAESREVSVEGGLNGILRAPKRQHRPPGQTEQDRREQPLHGQQPDDDRLT